MSKMEIFVAYCHRIGAYPRRLGITQTSKMESLTKTVNK